jgi:hypothetical protein
VAPADLRRVAHQGTGPVETLALHSQMAAEGVSEVQTRPGYVRLGVGIAKVPAQIVQIVLASLRRREEPPLRRQENRIELV